MVEDYPRTLMELERRLSDEAACRAYLFVLRWPDGFICPRCGANAAWTTARGLWVCGGCRSQVSVTAGTVFQDSKLPLTVWFRAIWQVTSQKNGMSALGLQRVLGLGSYKTAWALLHKLRRAMVRPNRDRLSGIVLTTSRWYSEVPVGASECGSIP
jgi:ribosomal protein L37AE/L43A